MAIGPSVAPTGTTTDTTFQGTVPTDIFLLRSEGRAYRRKPASVRDDRRRRRRPVLVGEAAVASELVAVLRMYPIVRDASDDYAGSERWPARCSVKLADSFDSGVASRGRWMSVQSGRIKPWASNPGGPLVEIVSRAHPVGNPRTSR